VIVRGHPVYPCHPASLGRYTSRRRLLPATLAYARRDPPGDRSCGRSRVEHGTKEWLGSNEGALTGLLVSAMAAAGDGSEHLPSIAQEIDEHAADVCGPTARQLEALR